MSKLMCNGSKILLTKEDVISLIEYALNKKLFGSIRNDEYWVNDVQKRSGRYMLAVIMGNVEEAEQHIEGGR